MGRILCIMLLLNTIMTHPDNSVPAVKHVPVGMTVKIPCEGYGNPSIAKWLYRREGKSFETIISERRSMNFQGNNLIRKRIIRDFTLEISPFTEDDKGIYVCELCTNQPACTKSKPISLIPQYALVSSKTHIIIKGSRFTYSCPHNDTLSIVWTFERQVGNTVTYTNSELADRGLLSIRYVQPSHSGKYRCWRQTQTGQWENVYSLTLCVLNVSAEELTIFPQNCTFYCDVNVDAEQDPITVVTDKGNISVTGIINKPKSCVICTINSSDEETRRTKRTEHNATQSGATEGRNSSHTAVPISICAAAFLLVALVILLWYLRLRWAADRIFCTDCPSMTRRSLQDEIETSVIYSTLEFSTHQNQSVVTSDHECVYSQINM